MRPMSYLYLQGRNYRLYVVVEDWPNIFFLGLRSLEIASSTNTIICLSSSLVIHWYIATGSFLHWKSHHFTLSKIMDASCG